MYFEKINAIKGTTVSDVFPDFSLFVYGGVNFEPYRSVFKKLIGKQVDTIELFLLLKAFCLSRSAKQRGITAFT